LLSCVAYIGFRSLPWSVMKRLRSGYKQENQHSYSACQQSTRDTVLSIDVVRV